jgi:SpoVK/Ycf46/Vps4 family AAA+-type ATPase
MTAKALATESGLNFLSVKGPELISKWVGETEDNIRDVFQKARENSPAMIFFDEFDALAKRLSGHESLSPVKALLAELDGVVELRGVLVLAATNNPEVIDSALLRPGRFSRLVYSGPPDLEARVEILKMHTAKRHLHGSVDLRKLAERTENWSGAEMVELCDVAAMKAEAEYRSNHESNRMTEKHFEMAFGDVHSQISEAMLETYKSWSVKGAKIMAK